MTILLTSTQRKPFSLLSTVKIAAARNDLLACTCPRNPTFAFETIYFPFCHCAISNDNKNNFIIMGNTAVQSNNDTDDSNSWTRGDSKPPFEFIIIILNTGVINHVVLEDQEEEDLSWKDIMEIRDKDDVKKTKRIQNDDDNNDSFWDSIPYAKLPLDNEKDDSSIISQVTDDLSCPYARRLPDNWYETAMLEQSTEHEMQVAAPACSSTTSSDDLNNHPERKNASLRMQGDAEFVYEKYEHQHLQVKGLKPVGDLLIPGMGGFLNQTPSFTC